MSRRITMLVACTALLAACQDDSAPALAPVDQTISGTEVKAVFSRYVAMGTSLSMGTESDGTVAASQQESWTSQLSQRAGGQITLPLISGTGCRAPFKAPLSSGVRTSGEPVTMPTANLACAPLREGLSIPTNNVAIAASRTVDALSTTPETQVDPFYKKLYQLVLPPHTTQVMAMRSQSPRFVSIEFGANEVLGVVSGVAIPGVTIFPFPTWVPLYHALVDSVAKVAQKGVIVGLVHDVANFPSMRRGDEIWADRTALNSAFNVAVSSDCTGSQNLVFVAARIPAAVAAGLTNRAKGLPAVPFSCADLGQGVADYVLSPSEQTITNAQLSQMNAEIAAVAAQYKFAHFELEALYGRPSLKGTFSSVELMTSPNPYGPSISLDGIHPSGNGYAILADAAAEAINARYGFNLATSRFIASR